MQNDSAGSARSADVIQSDDAAIEFLRQWEPDGLWCLSAINPHKQGDICTRTFRATDSDAAREFINSRIGKFNLYFSVNRLRHLLDRKARKADIAEMLALHVDVDPQTGAKLEDERADIKRLMEEPPKDVPLPSVVIDSGGGYQAFWLLQTPVAVENIKELEAYNLYLEKKFNADACHNIDRIMRLPGTVNLPTKSKLLKGRTSAPSLLIHADWTRRYRLSDFPIQTLSPSREVPNSSITEKVLIRKPEGKRSEYAFHIILECINRGFDDEQIIDVLVDAPAGERYGQNRGLIQAEIDRCRTKLSAEFALDTKGVIIASHQQNVRIAVAKLGVTLSHDTFQDRLLINGLKNCGPVLDDRSMERLWLLVDTSFGFRPAREFFSIVVTDAARRNPFHPVRDYLAELLWDGTPRIDRWLTTYGGAEDTSYIRAVGALFFIAAVRRVRQPGCKFDELLVLESEQGTHKSTALAILAVNDDWFSDDVPLNADGKRTIEALAGRWILEAAELKGMRKGEIEHLKAFLSRRVDRARMSYDRLVTEVPRACIIVGTTNSDRYLRDLTGNRRFWPVRVKAFDLETLKRDRDQLWAEGAYREARGESIRLDPALYKVASDAQGARLIDDPYTDHIAEALGNLNGKILSADAWKLMGKPAGQRSQEDNARFGEAMRLNGWERLHARIDGQVRWVYARGTAKERERRIEVHEDELHRPYVKIDEEEPF